MLSAPTLEQLQTLRLTAMAAAWTAQPQNAELSSLSFDERFALLVDAEWRARENKRLTRALQEAKFKLPHACVEAIDYPARRELDKALIRQLASCRWVEEHQQVLINDATGVGKTFIACALSDPGLPQGLPGPLLAGLPALPRLRAGPRRWHLHPAARPARPRRRLSRGRLGPRTLQEPERRDVLEILEDRSGFRSTIVTSQLPPGQWHDYVADPTLADAICDRLLHTTRTESC